MAIVVDLETYAHDCAVDFIEKPAPIPAPDLDAIGPRGGLTDPVKIEKSIQEKRAAAIVDHADAVANADASYRATLSRCSLDWNLNRIVALGFHDLSKPTPECWVLRDETDEAKALAEFWRLQQRHLTLIGFAARTFDAPTLVQRSRLLGISGFGQFSIGRYGRGDVVDLRDLLTFEDQRYEAIMPRSLKAFCKRFGIAFDDPTSGKDIAAMVTTGDWEGVRAHCLADVDMTRDLAFRLRVATKHQAVA